MTQLVLNNATVFDGVSEELVENGWVIIEDGIIKEVSSGELKTGADAVIDCAGRFLMPGLIDCHFHAYSATFDMVVLDNMPKSLLVPHAVKHLNDALQRGFTTVRTWVAATSVLHWRLSVS